MNTIILNLTAVLFEGSEGECSERFQALLKKQIWIMKDFLPVWLMDATQRTGASELVFAFRTPI